MDGIAKNCRVIRWGRSERRAAGGGGGPPTLAAAFGVVLCAAVLVGCGETTPRREVMAERPRGAAGPVGGQPQHGLKQSSDPDGIRRTPADLPPGPSAAERPAVVEPSEAESLESRSRSSEPPGGRPSTAGARPHGPQPAMYARSSRSEPQAKASANRADAEETRRSEPSDSPAALPAVMMTAQHAAMCKVHVGDTMPEIELLELDGKPRRLRELTDGQPAVVVFWSGNRALARAELADLKPDLSRIDPEARVRLVGIAVGETTESARQHAAVAGADFPQLVDSDSAAFAQVGTDRLPRTYVLDSKGTIVWFDIEYSRSTRREWMQSVRAILANP